MAGGYHRRTSVIGVGTDDTAGLVPRRLAKLGLRLMGRPLHLRLDRPTRRHSHRRTVSFAGRFSLSALLASLFAYGGYAGPELKTATAHTDWFAIKMSGIPMS